MNGVVLDVTEGVGTRLRGWGRYVAMLARALGDDVECVAGRVRGPELLWEQVGLPRALRRRGAALVHAPKCFLPLVRPCPGVVTINDLAFERFPEDFTPRTRWKYATFARRSAESAERVIVPSSYTGLDVCTRYGIAEAKVRVIPDAPALAIGTTPVERGDYLLAVGDVRPKKNLPLAEEAARRLGRELKVVGVGSDLGYVDDARLDELMRGAACLVHPSRYEGFGLVVVEAMARGIPVACANATALPETAGGAAELFDPVDPDDCAAAIERAIAGGGERGKARAAEFSWERTAAQTRAVYEELL
jgi:glycosyltransferase involved in cell wall biosynthesis